MKKCRFLAALILGIFLCAFSTVYAAEGNVLELPLAISWGTEGLIPGNTYYLTLEGTEKGTPMPKGSGDVYRMKLDENNKNTGLPEITYQEPGDYWYILKLIRADDTVVGAYYIRVMAVYEENRDLSVTTSIHKNKIGGIKTEQITFHDQDSDKTETPKPTETPEPSGKTENIRGKASQVKTGDETGILFYLLTGCAALCCILAAEKRKQKR